VEIYLRGLWDSGLRLSESLTLRWDHAPDAIVVDLTGRRPILRIPAELEKGNQDRLLPITPEFASLLTGIPECERRGSVFNLLDVDGTLLPPTRRLSDRLCRLLGRRLALSSMNGGKWSDRAEVCQR
jgi:integrase